MIMLYRLLVLTMLCPVCAVAQSARVDPLTLRTRDQHQDLLVVADPYITADRYKGVFGKKSPYDGGIIAIEIYFRNDNDSPIRLDLDTIRLVVSQPGEDRQQLEPLTPDDVADRVILNGHADPSVRVRRGPIPIPSTKPNKGKDWDAMDSAIRSVALGTDLPPHATTHGFLFFDMNHEFDAIRHSRVYIPDLSFVADKRALLFFEIDLGFPSAN